MAPPLVKGRALVGRRLAGVAFLLVIALLVGLAVAIYNKSFTETVDVALETDRVGNQLSVHADVKVRGLIVGEVRRIRSDGEKATLSLALDPDKVGLVPRNVRAQLLPKTLFGEKEVALVIPTDASAERIADGDRITQDRSSTALETETALNDLLPLLRALEPQKVAMTLNALSTALRGRGDTLGANLALNAAYFRRLNPALPTLGQDLQGLADFANSVSAATPDVLATLDNLSFSSRSLVEERASLDAFLRSTSDFADSARTLVADNERRLVALARDSLPSLTLFAKYAPGYPCLLDRVTFQNIEGERVFGRAQAGLHITVEPVADRAAGFAPGDEPQNKETRGPTCYGLGDKPVIPFPEYFNPQDGYRDDDPPADPGTGPGSAAPAAWMPPLVDAPTQTLRTTTLPRSLSPFEVLLLSPLTGSGF